MGIFVSINGFKRTVNDFLKLIAESYVKIVLISGKDIDEMFAENKDFLFLLRNKFKENVLLQKEKT